MGSPLSSASKWEEEAIGVVVVAGNGAGSLRICAGSGDKLGIAINS